MIVASPEQLMRSVEAIAAGKHLADAYSALDKVADFARPPESISTADCAERYRRMRLPKGDGYRLWSRELTPYMVPIMDALDDPDCQEVIVPKPGRCGGTVAFENYLFRLMKFGPMTDVGFYLGTGSEVTAYTDGQFKQLFDDHPEISDKLATLGSRDNKAAHKIVNGRSVDVLAAGARTFTNRQFGYMFGDEIDSYMKRYRASFMTQLRVRGRMLGKYRKGGAASHPDMGWSDGIAKLWVDTSRGIFVWPCNNCGLWSSPYPTKYWDDVPRAELVFEMADEHASRDEKLALAKESAALKCPHCQSALDDKQRHEMIDAGQYLHRGQILDVSLGVCGEIEDKTSMGFWIHGTMSKMVTHSELATDLLSARLDHKATGSTQKLREVISKTFGEPYSGAGAGADLDAKVLIDRTKEAARDDGGYRSGQVPDGPKFLTMSIDVQGSYFDLGIWGWDLEARSWLIERKTIRQIENALGQMEDIAPKENVSDWNVLDEELTRLIPMQSNPEMAMPIAVIGIDTGFATRNAYQYIASQSGLKWGPSWRRVRALKGNNSPKATELPNKPTAITVGIDNRPLDPPIGLWSLGVHKLKETVHDRVAIADGGAGQCYFPTNVRKSYLDQIFAEKMVDGKWEKFEQRNETLDLFGYADALRMMLDADRADLAPAWQDMARWPQFARPVRITGDDNVQQPEQSDTSKQLRSLFDQFNALNKGGSR